MGTREVPAGRFRCRLNLTGFSWGLAPPSGGCCSHVPTHLGLWDQARIPRLSPAMKWRVWSVSFLLSHLPLAVVSDPWGEMSFYGRWRKYLSVAGWCPGDIILVLSGLIMLKVNYFTQGTFCGYLGNSFAGIFQVQVTRGSCIHRRYGYSRVLWGSVCSII